MASEGSKFKMAMGKWADLAQDRLDALARQTCQEVAKAVVVATPVDTGFLRGSWQPSIGDAALAAAPKPGADPSGAIAQSAIAATIVGMKAGAVFHMRNNASYARRLEYGFVGQDSLGRNYNQTGRYYVRDTVMTWPQIVARVAMDLKL